MNRKDWRDCYWFDKGLNRQRITRKSTARAYISEALETIQDRVKSQTAKDWTEYRENLKPSRFETERAWDDRLME